MKVIAMTLRRAPERGRYIEEHLKKLQLDYELIDCVDFMDFTEEEYKKMYDEGAVRRNPYLTKGVIGCTLSHVKIYRKMVADNIPCALVIEDDAILPPDTKKILSLLEKEIGEKEVIALSYHNHSSHETYLSNKEKVTLGKNLELVYPVNLNDIASTMAYVITKPAAENLIRMQTPVAVSCDYWGVHYNKGAYTSFRCLYPMLVYPANFRTTIDYAAAKSILSKLAAIVRKHKIPLLYSFLERRSRKILAEKYVFRFSDEPPFYRQQVSNVKDVSGV